MSKYLELFEIVKDDDYSDDIFNSCIMTEGELYEFAEVEDYDSVDLEDVCNILWDKGYKVYNLRKSYPEAFTL
ncbi:hypothetical protein [Peptoniphilus timonensis]|uniref:hypothetical protein n=1 Tax=Peptoniphilus timonensis TaxID=1268254 RepID=UPI0002D89F23|nr:hypothetical protein [Peptoniphilus timonensis]